MPLWLPKALQTYIYYHQYGFTRVERFANCLITLPLEQYSLGSKGGGGVAQVWLIAARAWQMNSEDAIKAYKA